MVSYVYYQKQTRMADFTPEQNLTVLFIYHKLDNHSLSWPKLSNGNDPTFS